MKFTLFCFREEAEKQTLKASKHKSYYSKLNTRRKVDFISFLVFPLCFITYNIVYWHWKYYELCHVTLAALYCWSERTPEGKTNDQSRSEAGSGPGRCALLCKKGEMPCVPASHPLQYLHLKRFFIITWLSNDLLMLATQASLVRGRSVCCEASSLWYIEG